MKVASIEAFATRNVCFVRIQTDDGQEGIGQTAWSNADITARVLHRQIAPHVLGKNPEDIDSIVTIAYRPNSSSRGLTCAVRRRESTRPCGTCGASGRIKVSARCWGAKGQPSPSTAPA